MQKSLEDSQTNGDTLKGKLSKLAIDNAITAAVSQVAAPRKGAIQDILSRGRGVFSLDDDGNVVPRDGEGKLLYGTDGKAPLTMDEWAQSQLLEAAYLFEPNSGGGGFGGDKGGGGDGKVIAVGDQSAVNNSIEAIAKGDVIVSE
jgi:hypothetical protein